MIIMIIMVATVAVFFDNGGTNGNPAAPVSYTHLTLPTTPYV